MIGLIGALTIAPIRASRKISGVSEEVKGRNLVEEAYTKEKKETERQTHRNIVERQTHRHKGGVHTGYKQWLNYDVERRAPCSKPWHEVDQHEVHL